MTPPVFVNSVPKAGTHLLKRGLALLPGFSDAGVHVDISHALDDVRARLLGVPGGGIATGHLVHRADYLELLRALPHVHLLMLRDPRDVALSLAEYIPRLAVHYLNARFQELTPSERLATCIAGLAGPAPAWDGVALNDIAAEFRRFTPWSAEPGVVTVRFEDLVGPDGGGSAAQQQHTVAAIATRLGLALDEADYARVAQGIFDRESPTFREGAIGGWRQRFGTEHVRLFKDVAGDLLIELGYERDLDW